MKKLRMADETKARSNSNWRANKIVHTHRDKTLLAYMGKRKQLVRILTTTSTGAVSKYEFVDKPGITHTPLVVDGKNVDNFEILGEQLKLF
ncbi:hypothetical protein [Tissierella sp.]|uniref:hypothetical protein n=1 Tax=Tissierella sp. TaxID=41274 RepID=UPI003028742B